MRLGVLGGSFDPIHHAHLVVARLAVAQLALDRVHFVVAAAQPFKLAGHGASATDRMLMVELALDGIADFVADDRELRRPAPSYTVDTLRDLHHEFPGAELVLLMGADSARGFASWREPEVIRQLATVAVFARAGEPVPAGFDREVDVPVMLHSSTAVRARIGRGESLDGWVPPAVADYIATAQLYGRIAG